MLSKSVPRPTPASSARCVPTATTAAWLRSGVSHITVRFPQAIPPLNTRFSLAESPTTELFVAVRMEVLRALLPGQDCDVAERRLRIRQALAAAQPCDAAPWEPKSITGGRVGHTPIPTRASPLLVHPNLSRNAYPTRTRHSRRFARRAATPADPPGDDLITLDPQGKEMLIQPLTNNTQDRTTRTSTARHRPPRSLRLGPASSAAAVGLISAVAAWALRIPPPSSKTFV